jgi:hypothetical protein
MFNVLYSISNWLTGGALKKYQAQANAARESLGEISVELERYKMRLQQTESQLEEAQFKLRQVETAQSQMEQIQTRLQQAKSEYEHYQNQIQQVREKLSQLQENERTHLSVERKKIEIVDVVPGFENNTEVLRGFILNLPVKQNIFTGGSILLRGWVLGKQEPIKNLRIVCQERILEEAPINQSRPAIGKRYAEIAEAATCGFDTSVAIPTDVERGELSIEGVTENGSTVALGSISFITSPVD